jgi:mycoredoxin
MDSPKIKVYGTTWCGETRRTREYFDINNIEYEWIDIDKDSEAADIVKSINNGYKSVPTIVFPDGSTLTEPSLYALKEKFAKPGK